MIETQTSHPRFLSIEGGEGAGKSSLIRAIQDQLAAQGHTVTLTREPGGTPVAERIREVLLTGGEEAICDHAELLLMFAARAQHLEHVIRPALARGDYVICDRFIDSSYAYQGAGRGMPLDTIASLERMVVDVVPSLTLLLDLDVKQGTQRARSRPGTPDRIEVEHQAFFERVRQGYRSRADADPERIRVIDASQPMKHVQQDALSVVADWMELPCSA
ncbi:MAG: dTMP kinase [Hydrogenophilales bacterium RIFOXYD1_FULL_62_11]|nr:MAG: dTMP kinase [Hydrogenophilales bacterium RIFOXYD1_FULL_62_11]